MIREAAGRYVISCNEAKQDTDDKKADLKLQTDSHSSGISPTPPNESSMKKKQDAENYSPKRRDAVKWQGYKIDMPVKSVQMQEDFWKDGNSWNCFSCATTFRLEIAFRNHLRRQEACNQQYICMTCNDLL